MSTSDKSSRTTTFADRVYEIVREIPKGKVSTYGQVAGLAGNTRAARAVGMLMAKNKDIPKTPCHRVVAKNGALHGYSGRGGISQKRKMLIAEGVFFNGNRVDLEKSLTRF